MLLPLFPRIILQFKSKKLFFGRVVTECQVMESFRRAFLLISQSLGNLLNHILPTNLSLASSYEATKAVIIRAVRSTAFVTRALALGIFSTLHRVASYLKNRRLIDLRKLKSCQLVATLLACLSLVLAGIAFWVSFDALRYAKWTAHKEFTLLCHDEVCDIYSSG